MKPTIIFVSFIFVLFSNNFGVGASFIKCTHDSDDNTYLTEITFDCEDLEEDSEPGEALNSINRHEYQYCDNEYVEDIFRYAHKVYFEHCKVSYIPHDLFHILENAQTIYFDLAGIETIDSGKFADGSELQTLSMSKNNLTELPAFLFSHTPKIQDVDFAYNQINKIDPKVFGGGAKKLQTIDLSHNLIEVIEQNVFADLADLTELRLGYNLIQAIQFELKLSTNLEALYLNNNRITQVNCDSFINSTSAIALVDLSKNRLTEINLNCEKQFAELNVMDNQIKSLNLSSLNKLWKVHASGNKIETIFIENDLVHLKYLIVANNSLTKVSDIFAHCPSLKTLDLSNNDIRTLDPNSFIKMSELEYLHMNHINLSRIEHGTFSHNRLLVELDVSHNKLSKINFDLFLPSFANLEKFLFNDNNLTELVGFSYSMFPRLRKLAVSNNDFNCTYLANFLRATTPLAVHLVPSFPVVAHTKERKSISGISCIDTDNIVMENDEVDEIHLIKPLNGEGISVNDRNAYNDQINSIINKFLQRSKEDKINDKSYQQATNFLLAFLCFLCLPPTIFAIIQLVKTVAVYRKSQLNMNEQNTIYLQENNHQSCATLNTLLTGAGAK